MGGINIFSQSCSWADLFMGWGIHGPRYHCIYSYNIYIFSIENFPDMHANWNDAHRVVNVS